MLKKLINPKIFEFNILTPEEEAGLFALYRDKGCIESRNRILTAYMRVVPSIVRQVGSARNNDDEFISELMAEGNLALVKSIDNYDHKCGVSFNAYIKNCIRYEIYQYLIDRHNHIRLATTKDARKLFFKIHTLEYRGEYPTNSEFQSFADKHDAKFDLVVDMWTKCCGSLIRSDSAYSDVSELLTLPDSTNLEFIDQRSRKENTEKLTTALKALGTRDYDIINSRFLTDNRCSLSELANRYNVSVERIRQIEKRVLMSMSAYFCEAA